MIPQDRTASVTRALSEAFGVTEFEDIRPMTKGNLTTGLVYRIVVRGTPYLMRLILRPDDPSRQIACMSAAAAAGLAPLVRHSSIEDKISITDWIETTPLSRTEALVRVPAALRAVHALPPFAGAPHHLNTTCMFLLHEGPARDGFLARFRAANLLPPDQTEQLLACLAQLTAAYRQDEQDFVSSHNDLFKPDNILFDGQRIWLVDWEAAFLNDRYADLAVVANQIVRNDAEEELFLQSYFGAPPTAYQRTRLFLMRQLAHVFYGLSFLFIASMAGPVDLNGTAPGYHEFQTRFWNGEIALRDSAMKVIFAKVHMQRALENMRQARFREALEIVSSWNFPTTAPF